MAEKRMISKVISISKKFNIRLNDHFTRLLYILLIPHSDDFGRLTGDPFKIKALILPMMSEVDWEEVEKSLDKLHQAELINWYESTDERFIQIINFDDHQQGLHKRTRSKFPEPPNYSRKFPEIPSELNRTELNRTEEKGTEQKGVSVDYQSKITEWMRTYEVTCKGFTQLETVLSFVGTMDIEVIEHCIKISEKKHVPFLESVLQRHLNEGKTTKESIRVVRAGPGEREAEIQQRKAEERKNVIDMVHQPDPMLGKVAGND